LCELFLKVQVVCDEEQAGVIRWLAPLYANGTSTLELAKTLTEQGTPTPEGTGQWQPVMIRRILSNERLTGRVQNFAHHNPRAKEHLEPIDLPDGTYPAIISEELFARLQVRLARNKEESTRKVRGRKSFYCGLAISAALCVVER